MKLSICFCAYNEQTNIAECILDAQKAAPQLAPEGDYEIIVVDNASTDKTPDVVLKLAQSDPHIRLIRHSQNMYYSGSYRTIFREAKGDFIAIIDGDFQHTALDIANGLKLLENPAIDVVFGWKKSRRDDFKRKIFSLGLRFISQVLIQHPLHDINCGYRVLRKSAARQIVIKETLNTVGPEIYCECRKLSLGVAEMTVQHYPRTQGQGMHGTLIPLIKNSIKFFKYLWRLNRRYRQLAALEAQKP